MSTTDYTVRQAADDLRSSGASGWSQSPDDHGGTTSRPTRPARSRPCWSCAIRSSGRSLPDAGCKGGDDGRAPGPTSTITTRRCARDMLTLFIDIGHHDKSRRRINNIRSIEGLKRLAAVPAGTAPIGKLP
jgi:hypothetical protein